MAFVIAITGMLAALAVTHYSDQIPHQQLRDISSLLVGELRLARQKAISRGADETILFDSKLRQYKDSSLGTQTLPNHVRFGSDPKITKAPSGDSNIPQDGITFVGNSATFRPNGTGKNGTIYLTNSKNESVSITINFTGRVRKYVWNGHDWE